MVFSELDSHMLGASMWMNICYSPTQNSDAGRIEVAALFLFERAHLQACGTCKQVAKELDTLCKQQAEEGPQQSPIIFLKHDVSVSSSRPIVSLEARCENAQ